MKFASFSHEGHSTWGMVQGESLLDLGRASDGRYPTLRAFLSDECALDPNVLAASANEVRLADVKLEPVIPDPTKIFCVGHNYESHRAETGRAKVDYPSIFLRFPDTLVGAGAGILRPSVSTKLDYEGELAVIIGRAGRRIAEQDAMLHVAGYSCFNDASVRDWQWHTSQFTPGKNFPGTGAFGPTLVTVDEVPDPAVLVVTTRLNGTIVQSQPTAEMIFSIPRIIAYISTFTALNAGDVIATGTPGGVGAKRTPPLWLTPGDTIEVDIPGVGLLTNPIVQGS